MTRQFGSVHKVLASKMESDHVVLACKTGDWERLVVLLSLTAKIKDWALRMLHLCDSTDPND